MIIIIGYCKAIYSESPFGKVDILRGIDSFFFFFFNDGLLESCWFLFIFYLQFLLYLYLQLKWNFLSENKILFLVPLKEVIKVGFIKVII